MLQLKALLKRHPWRFLLYVEWTLLLIVALSEVIPFSLLTTRHPLLNWVCLLLFATIGLQLPTAHITKIAYTSFEFVLILIASIWGGIHLTPLLYIVLVIRNGLLFNDKIRFVVLGFAFFAFLLTLNHRFQTLTLSSPWFVPEDLRVILLTLILLMGIVLVFSQLLVERALAERQNQVQLSIVNSQLESANTQLRQYALQIEELATVQERNRIAREIHDALGHSLTVFNLHLEAALRLLETDPAEAKELLIEAKQLGKTALSEVRQSVSALRSDPLQAQPLAVAITALVAEFQRSTSVTPVCKLELNESISAGIRTTVYRVVQESLTNIYKYAEATMVKIEITILDDVLQALIEDNGKGFNLDQNTTGFGLQGMRERAQALGGTLEILTSSGAGCCVILRCPLS